MKTQEKGIERASIIFGGILIVLIELAFIIGLVI